jgi:hypothetical protein
VLACAHKLNPLVQALAEYVRSAPVIFSDDTTLALQQPRVKGQPRRGRTVTARLWAYLAGGWRQDAEGQWQRIAPAALYAFVGDGAVEVDNNVAERAMRLVALSRKNWLFAGSERGGQAAAVAFSLIETARLNGVEPWAYLKDVLKRIDGHRVDCLHELLPMHWKAAAA